MPTIFINSTTIKLAKNFVRLTEVPVEKQDTRSLAVICKSVNKLDCLPDCELSLGRRRKYEFLVSPFGSVVMNLSGT